MPLVLRPVALIALLLAGLSAPACTELRVEPPSGIQASFGPAATRPATPAPRAIASELPAAFRGNGAIALVLQLPAPPGPLPGGAGPVRRLSATADDITRIAATLSGGGSVGAIARTEVQRAEIIDRTASLQFKGLSAGDFVLAIEAFDHSGQSIGSVTEPVSVITGRTTRVMARLQLNSTRPSTAPRPLPIASVAPAPVVVVPSPAASPTPSPTAAPTVAPTAAPLPERIDYSAILQAGIDRDLASPVQRPLLLGAIALLSAPDRVALDQTLVAARTTAERVFILKAVIAGEPWAFVASYASEMRGQSEAVIIAKSTMRDDSDLIQQWQDACGPALLQVAAGEYDPRYAWELNRLYSVAIVAPTGVNQGLATQQKEWLEFYGGTAVERDAPGGQGIGILNLLNDHLSPITRAAYVTRGAESTGDALEEIATHLRTGYDVPLRVTYEQPGATEPYGHFMVALAVSGALGNRSFQIHDSFSGKTAWLTEAALLANDFTPFFDVYTRLSHYYEPIPQ